MLVGKPYIGEPGKEDHLSSDEEAIPIVQVASAIGAGITATILGIRTWL
ncbi:MAG: hypothetical protein M1508_10490 [Nitrospirae bacterium]|nr:hypothetical protein [Nitrospirota bacterium]MCL5422587.1 hypothetical protein [Nitrospirota bacterium]